ncbi:hypothetical protein HY994_04945 [Candidatus Micrarchaeota archaeon]|nr:hypothetical protein [Candidatus Micrarchaeota archaeon]
MLVLEALMGLWFWTQLSSAVLLPSAPVSLFSTSRVLESAWHTPDAA